MTESGELYWTGDLSGKFGYTFTKYDYSTQIKDIQGNETSFFLLDDSGNVDLFSTYVEMDRIMPTDGLQNIISFSVSNYNLLAINRKGVIYYSGEDIYKYRSHSGNFEYPTIINNIRNAREVYCSSMYAYVVTDDKIIVIPLDKENRIKKFIHDYNIFAPHPK